MRVDDLLSHAVAFFVLTVFAGVVWKLSGKLVAGLVTIVAVLEIAQFLIPDRTPSMMDFTAGLFGILAACGVSAIKNRVTHRLRRDRFQPVKLKQ